MGKMRITLVELLIVAAVITILAIISIPNFLQAQVRQKCAQTFRDLEMLKKQANIRYQDTNLWLIGGDDSIEDDGISKCAFKNGYHFFGVGCIQAHECKCLHLGDHFFNGQIWGLLTTPVPYLTHIPTDPFGGGLFYGYEDRNCPNASRAKHWLIFAAGPDQDVGDWFTNRDAVRIQSL
jgi:Tfp pilus assembly protein PilE